MSSAQDVVLRKQIADRGSGLQRGHRPAPAPAQHAPGHQAEAGEAAGGGGRPRHGGARPPVQNCGRGDTGQGGGQHHNLGQGQGQGEPRVCGAIRVRDVQDRGDHGGAALPPHADHQVSHNIRVSIIHVTMT